MKIRPTLDKVVAEVQKSDSVSIGGIILAGGSKENQPITAKVIAEGPGTYTPDGKLVKMTIHVGDTILIPRDAGTHFKKDGKEYVVISQAEILATIYPNT